jgi:serine-type D-Ala-D-Ala carboxypeptidase (penicillin-binding protein 5/6)
MHMHNSNVCLHKIGALLALTMAIGVVSLAGAGAAPLLGAQGALAVSDAQDRAHPSLEWPAEGEAAVEVEGIGHLDAFGASAPVPIASVAKVMTAYLTLLEHPLPRGRDGFTLRVTEADVQDEQSRAALGQSVLPVLAGERLDERQALQALLLPSANNVAQMLAAHEAGSVESFVGRMNETARRLGMTETAYTDPSGYSASTVSTASDQLRLAVVAMRLRAFAQIVDEPSVVLPVAGRVSNYDALVGHDGYVGIKTGSDSAAGGCLVFAKRVVVGGHRLMVVGDVLGQRDGSYIAASLLAARRLGDSAAAALRVGMFAPAGAAAFVDRRLAQLL